MTTFALHSFPQFGFYPQHSHARNELLEDDSPQSLSRSPSSSSIEYPLDSETSSSNLTRLYKSDSVVAPPPLLPTAFGASADSSSNSTSPSGSPVHPSAVQVKRKRGRPPKPKNPSQAEEASSPESGTGMQEGVVGMPPASPPKRKRGRPPGKKKKAEHEFLYYVDESTGSVTSASKQDEDYSDDGKTSQQPHQQQNPFGFSLAALGALTPQPPVKRGRGRPRKYPLPGQSSIQKPLQLSGSMDWIDPFDQDSISAFNFEPPSDYAIVDYLRSVVNEQSKSFLGYGEVRGLLECHFGMDLQYRQCYIEESLDLLCPYS